MSADVKHLTPSTYGKGNIPHMLRAWADDMEAGRDPMPESALLILVNNRDERPEMCEYGKKMSVVTLLGVLYACAHMAERSD